MALTVSEKRREGESSRVESSRLREVAGRGREVSGADAGRKASAQCTGSMMRSTSPCSSTSCLVVSTGEEREWERDKKPTESRPASIRTGYQDRKWTRAPTKFWGNDLKCRAWVGPLLSLFLFVSNLVRAARVQSSRGLLQDRGRLGHEDGAWKLCCRCDADVGSNGARRESAS